MSGPSFVAIDFEHCNHSYASICSIGAVRVRDGEIVGEPYVRHIRPASGFDHIARGLLNRGFTVDIDSVANGLGIRRALLEIKNSIYRDGGENHPTTIVGHGIVSADLPMLHQAWHSAFPDDPMGLPALPVACTSEMARVLRPDLPSTKLNVVAAAVIPEFTLDHHDAGSDAEACARIALALAPNGLEPWTKMARPSSRRAKVPTFGPGDIRMPARTHALYTYEIGDDA